MKTLIVEDSPETREVLQTYLHTLGHEVTVCPDAESALEACQQEFYPLIISDLSLPEMDGLELCWRIRALPRGELCMIMIITGFDEPELLERVLNAGADDFLVKPLRMKTLQIRVVIMEREYQYRVQRRKVQEELLKYREQLEEVVEERTAELKRKNASLQAILERSQQLFLFIDPEYTIQALTPRVKDVIRNVYGVDVEEGHRLDPSLFFSNPASFEACFEKALGGEFVGFEHEVKREDDRLSWFMFQFNPVITDNNQIVGVYLSISDITKRKQS